MKFIWLLVFCAMMGKPMVCIIPESESVNEEDGWYIPRSDGTFYWVEKILAYGWLVDLINREKDILPFTPVNFYLYTSSHPTQGIEVINTTTSIGSTKFNANNPTRFIIHGWTQDSSSEMNNVIRKAWFSRGDHNIIVVDWERARHNYISSVAAVPYVGMKVASMINFLVANHGLNLGTLYVIGHSLGAHVAGHTGKHTKGQVHTIIGLDPAEPLFSYNRPNFRLTSKDAFYVETIQTNSGRLGFLEPIGKNAFYPNGGKKQPGCGFIFHWRCSHGRSVTYYAEAVTHNNFAAIQCDTYNAAVHKKCGSTYSRVRMAADSNANTSGGVFYVPVNSEAPFGTQ